MCAAIPSADRGDDRSPAPPPRPTKWVRPKRSGAHGLRRGAWYQVVNDNSPSLVILHVRKTNVPVPRSMLEFSDSLPAKWSVVKWEESQRGSRRASESQSGPHLRGMSRLRRALAHRPPGRRGTDLRQLPRYLPGGLGAPLLRAPPRRINPRAAPTDLRALSSPARGRSKRCSKSPECLRPERPGSP